MKEDEALTATTFIAIALAVVFAVWLEVVRFNLAAGVHGWERGLVIGVGAFVTTWGVAAIVYIGAGLFRELTG
jgi:hypothetical protein